MRTDHFKIVGMNRPGCIQIVERTLARMGGVRSVHASFLDREATVEYDEHVTSPGKLKLAIMGAGYDVANAVAA